MVKRFSYYTPMDADANPLRVEEPTGDNVTFEDYAKLETELKELKEKMRDLLKNYIGMYFGMPNTKEKIDEILKLCEEKEFWAAIQRLEEQWETQMSYPK